MGRPSVASAWAAAPSGRAAADAQVGALRFTAGILFAALVLQRFGFPFPGKPVNIVGPIGIGLAAWGVLNGTLAFDRGRLAAYCALAACAMLGLAWHALSPSGFGEGANLQSLSQFLLLTSFACLTFAEPVDERRFFREVNRWFAIIAVAGVLQFVLQFVGLRVFAFTGIVPDALLYEFPYNLQIPTGFSDALKSNGFFLVEPSVFSQVMALALIIEVLAFRRVAFLCLFVAGLLTSFAGTGWIVLGSFVAAAGLGLGWRGLAIAGGMVLVVAVLFGVVSTFAPDVAGAFQQRMDEISRPSTSGHRRFITPFWLLDDTLTSTPSAALLGLGSGISERLTMPYAYDVNTPIKIALDYGFPALLIYVLLFVMGRKSPVQAAILVPAAVMFFITGSYTQFPPMLFLVLLLTSVARLRTDQAAPASR